MTKDSIAANSDLHQAKKTWSPYTHLSDGMRARLRRLWSGLRLNRSTASQLRYEFDMLLLRSRCTVSHSHRKQIRDLARRHGLLVHLGCGNALLHGWINIDCYPPPMRPGVDVLTIDMRMGLPFVDRTVSALFSEHFFEHLPVEMVRDVILPEVVRILEPGGHVRIGVPNGEYFIDKYIQYRAGSRDTLFEQHRGNSTPMTVLNDVAHSYGHYFLYDFETMKGMLEAAGFRDVWRTYPGVTDVPAFRGKDRLDDWRQAMTLYVEARADR